MNNPCGNNNCNEINAGIDECIKPLIKALNDCGMETVASCCGHGKRPGNIVLKDGREIVITSDYETAREIDKMFPDIHGNYLYKEWRIEFNPKPIPPGIADWDATHPDIEELLFGKSFLDLKEQIDDWIEGEKEKTLLDLEKNKHFGSNIREAIEMIKYLYYKIKNNLW